MGHHGAECSFDAFVHKYALDKDPAMAYMAKVIRGTDTADKTIKGRDSRLIRPKRRRTSVNLGRTG